MRLVVTGLTGQVSRALQELRAADIEIIPVGRPALDLAKPESVLPALRAAAPDIIVNAAAYTQVDAAERDTIAAHAANHEGAGAVAAAAAALNAPLIHLSTDYVFDGTKGAPYAETDAPNPLGVYGASKLAGERAVAETQPHHVILRLSWVYGPHGHNFVRTMLRLAGERDSVRVVGDQHGAPTCSTDIATAIAAIARRLAAAPEDARFWGVHHLGAGGATTWADFAEAIFAEAGARGGASARVERISTAEFNAAAKRPACSLLDSEKAARIFGVRLPEWRASLGACVERLLTDTAPR